ncbi:MAG: hypothetical protein A3J73_03130 [Planctomycetes bacterium RIFCSPHIGHO2_02_FULL_38_41]|nr:MAG: hypothetical protein A3J73_03130 [Planctomycetes bacterium RIFCSPHIGHO2_02_FULL_38_41]OHB97199.1 MAG: hypothetical protein A2W74_00705 [Planctomycetes bacterium RIFCSPLOWO2_12_38_17]
MNKKVIIGSIVVIFFTSLIFQLIFLGNTRLPALLWLSIMALYFIGLNYFFLWFLVKRYFSARHADNLLINLSIFLTASIFLLVAAEFALRFVFRDITTTGDNASYFMKKWNKTVRYNTFGFREKDFDLAKPAVLYRIAVIGDSITYGQGVEEEDRFTNLMEKQLNNQDNSRTYEVSNFGRPGAETVDELGFLINPVLSTNPDFVLLQWYVNDVVSPDVKRNAPRRLILIPQKLRLNSALFYLLHKQFSTLQSNLRGVTDYEEYMLPRFSDQNSTSSLQAKETMKLFMQICKKFHIPLGLVLFPDYYFNRESKRDFLLERVVQLCEEEGIPCVDMRSTFAPYQGDLKLWASRLDQHPSAFANRLVADRIMEAFGDTWLQK